MVWLFRVSLLCLREWWWRGPFLCLPLLDLVKCINSHFTWSILSPLSLSLLCAVLNAALTIWVASSLVWAMRILIHHWHRECVGIGWSGLYVSWWGSCGGSQVLSWCLRIWLCLGVRWSKWPGSVMHMIPVGHLCLWVLVGPFSHWGWSRPFCFEGMSRSTVPVWGVHGAITWFGSGVHGVLCWKTWWCHKLASSPLCCGAMPSLHHSSQWGVCPVTTCLGHLQSGLGGQGGT